MPRKQRIDMPGVPVHVVQRGNNRQACFFDEGDYRKYLECLAEAASENEVDIHAYVLMTNHVHILAKTNKPYAVSWMMQSVGRRYVQYVNYVYKRSGTLWEGRFKSSIVKDERYVLTCYRYIELNPVRANMVAHPSEYRWSSFRANAFDERDDAIDIKPHEIYLALHADKDKRQAAYRELFKTSIEPNEVNVLKQCVEHNKILEGSQFEWLLAERAR